MLLLICWHFTNILPFFSINKSPQKKEPDGPDAKVTPCKRHRQNSQYGYENLFKNVYNFFLLYNHEGLLLEK